MKKIILILLGLNSLIFANFTRENGIVKDSITQLEWQDNYDKKNIPNISWIEAIDYCEQLNLVGSNWRLPNKKEILSIFNYATFGINSIFNQIVIEESIAKGYWSSTSLIRTEASESNLLASVLNFKLGIINGSSKIFFKQYVRCVR